MSNKVLYGFGNNSEGQLGIPGGEEIISIPTEVIGSFSDISHIVSSRKNSVLICKDGCVYTCGENEFGELARSGKRSIFSRVEMLETVSIVDVSCGNGYFIAASNKGVYTWGVNSIGELGNGDKERIERPKLNVKFSFAEGSTVDQYTGIVCVSSGKSHSLALSKFSLSSLPSTEDIVGSGVYSWGANSKSQLGGHVRPRGTASPVMSHSYTPRPIARLRNRPIIQIACGEEFSLALTSTGLVYSWGDNTKHQLGRDTGDAVSSSSAEAIPSLRSAKTVCISAGGSHAACVVKSGLLFMWGSNSFGQCGCSPLDMRVVEAPKPVDRLNVSSGFAVVSVACGLSHTLMLCRVRTAMDGVNILFEQRPIVFSMGSNSNGQLGHGTGSECPYPKLIRFESRKVDNDGDMDTEAAVNTDVVMDSEASASNEGVVVTGGVIQRQSSMFIDELNERLSPISIPIAVFASSLSLHSFVLCETVIPERTHSSAACSHDSLGSSEVESERELSGSIIPTTSWVRRVCPLTLELKILLTNLETATVYVRNSPYVVPDSVLKVIKTCIMTLFSSVSLLLISFFESAEFDFLQNDDFSNKINGFDVELLRKTYDRITALDGFLNNNYLAVHRNSGSTSPVRSNQLNVLESLLVKALATLSDSLINSPVDEPENLVIFLIILEFPGFKASMSKYHLILEKVVVAVCALSKSQRSLWSNLWLQNYPAEHFGKIVMLLQSYLSFKLAAANSGLSGAQVLRGLVILECLYLCNCAANTVPESMFYNHDIVRYFNIFAEFEKYKQYITFVKPSESNAPRIFNIYQYSFILSIEVKAQVMRNEFHVSMQKNINRHVLTYVQQLMALNTALVRDRLGAETTNNLSVVNDPISETLRFQTPANSQASETMAMTEEVTAATGQMPESAARAVAQNGGSVAAVSDEANPRPTVELRPVLSQESVRSFTSSVEEGNRMHISTSSGTLDNPRLSGTVHFSGNSTPIHSPSLAREGSSSRENLTALDQGVPTNLPGESSQDSLPRQATAIPPEVLRYLLPVGVTVGMLNETDPGAPAGTHAMLFDAAFQMTLNRQEDLFRDAVRQLVDVMIDDKSTLQLPLRINFVNEDAVDRGGVMKEFFSIIMAEFVFNSGILAICDKNVWFSRRNHYDFLLEAMVRLQKAKVLPPKLMSLMNSSEDSSELDVNILFPEYLLGVFVGLALYNGVLIDIPLPSVIYKVTWLNSALTLYDLLLLDPTVGRSLQMLLDFSEEDTGQTVQDTFALTFEAPANPIYATYYDRNGKHLSDKQRERTELYRALSFDQATNERLGSMHLSGSSEDIQRKRLKGSASSSSVDGMSGVLPVDASSSSAPTVIGGGRLDGRSSEMSYSISSAGGKRLYSQAAAVDRNINIRIRKAPDQQELKENGANIEVTRLNRQEFVDRFVYHSLYNSCKSEITAFTLGIQEVVTSTNWMAIMCSHVEIDGLVCGTKGGIENLIALRPHTTYHGGVFNDKHPVIEWFWHILSEFSEVNRRRFLHFVCGSDRVPVGGLSRMKLFIQSNGMSEESLPTSHTCFNLLDLSVNYPNEETLKRRLLVALQHSYGFGFA